jgi:acetyltransferase-like isoleucine patch superfamily enzyme
MNRSNLESMNLTSGQILFAIFFAILPSSLKVGVLRSKGAKVGRNVTIGFGTVILAPDYSKVKIGMFTRISYFTIIACSAISIGRYVRISMFTWIWGAGRLVLKDKSQIAARVRIDLRNNDFYMGVASGVATGVIIYTHTQAFPYTQGWIHRRKDVVLEDYVMIGLGSLLLPGVRVGDHTYIGAGSVVVKDIPQNSFAAGNPARVISSVDRFREKVDEKEFRRRVEEIALDMLDYFGFPRYSKKRTGDIFSLEFGVPRTFSTERWTLVVAAGNALMSSGHMDRLDGDRTVLFSTTDVPADVRARIHLWFDLRDHRCGDLPTEFSVEVWNYLYETWQEMCDLDGPGLEPSGRARP